MGLPQYEAGPDYVLTPEDLTPEVMTAFERHCRATEMDMLATLFREPARLGDKPAPTFSDSSEEADVFASVFK